MLRSTIGLVVVTALTACGERPATREAGGSETQIPNPAAEFCVEQGGEYLLESGECRLNDGTTVDAWEYFREQQGE